MTQTVVITGASAAPGSDHGAHGVFDEKSHPRSAQLRTTRHTESVGSAVTRALDSLLAGKRRTAR